MNKEKQRIEIARACGWTNIAQAYREFASPTGIAPDFDGARQDMPDYLNDLNAMHEAEKVLTPTQRKAHGRILQEVTMECVVGFVPDYDAELRALSRLASASAAQRAEALLRCLGKWED